jgi:hypothetical protein
VGAFHALFDFSVDMERFHVPKRRLIQEMDKKYGSKVLKNSCFCFWSIIPSCCRTARPKGEREQVVALSEIGALMEKGDSRNSKSMLHLKEELEASKTWRLLIENIKNLNPVESPVFKFFVQKDNGKGGLKCLGSVTLSEPVKREASLKIENW